MTSNLFPWATLNNTVDANIVIGVDGNTTIWNATTKPGGYMLPGPTDVRPPMAPIVSAAQLGLGHRRRGCSRKIRGC